MQQLARLERADGEVRARDGLSPPPLRGARDLERATSLVVLAGARPEARPPWGAWGEPARLAAQAPL